MLLSWCSDKKYEAIFQERKKIVHIRMPPSGNVGPEEGGTEFGDAAGRDTLEALQDLIKSFESLRLKVLKIEASGQRNATNGNLSPGTMKFLSTLNSVLTGVLAVFKLRLHFCSPSGCFSSNSSLLQDALGVQHDRVQVARLAGERMVQEFEYAEGHIQNQLMQITANDDHSSSSP